MHWLNSSVCKFARLLVNRTLPVVALCAQFTVAFLASHTAKRAIACLHVVFSNVDFYASCTCARSLPLTTKPRFAARVCECTIIGRDHESAPLAKLAHTKLTGAPIKVVIGGIRRASGGCTFINGT
jgi:hypothetical protein